METIRLPAEAASAAAARRFVRGMLHRSHHGSLEDAALLCVTELVANVTVHTDSSECLVTVRSATRDVTIEVSDAATEMPAMEPAPLYAEHGRGLNIVDAVSCEWGVSPGAGRCKSVWARLCEPGPATGR